MAIRQIPPKTKTSTTIIGNFTIKDFILLLGVLVIVLVILLSSIWKPLKIAFIFVLVVFYVLSITTIDEKKGYTIFFYGLKYLFRNKKYEGMNLKTDSSFKFIDDFEDDKVEEEKTALFEYEGYYYAIMEIKGVNFSLYPEYRQDMAISKLANLFKSIREAKIIKLDNKIDYHRYKNNLVDISAKLQNKINNTNDKNIQAGIEKRIEINEELYGYYDYVDNTDMLKTPYFYLILSSSKTYQASVEEKFYDDENTTQQEESTENQALTHLLDVALQSQAYLKEAGLESDLLYKKEGKRILEIFFDSEFDSDENLILPNIKEKWDRIIINGEAWKVLTLGQLPIRVANAWAWKLFNIPNIKVSMNFQVAPDKQKVIKAIDKSLIEYEARYNEKNITESRRTQIEADYMLLKNLLQDLKMENEQLHIVNLFILSPFRYVKEVENALKDFGIYTDRLFYRQIEAYESMIPYKKNNPKLQNYAKNFQSTTLASMFPFVSQVFTDTEGSYMGLNTANNSPVFFDLFDSWKQHHGSRTNANLCIIGSSGKGKSYFCKKLLLQQACNDVRIYILDPEDEYKKLTKELHGNWIDIGGSSYGIINPLQVYQTMPSDDEGNVRKEVSSHRQFLQEFFNITIPTLDPECRAYLNQALAHVYEEKNITDETDLKTLKNSDFPILQDLFVYVSKWFESADSDYDKKCLRKLKNELEDFATGGVHSELWNGYTTLDINNDFNVFNFQSLLANSNKIIGNGQMLLLMRLLMQEIIKNKAYNDKLGLNQNVLILVDEAHQFINEKNPIALNFMVQMAKRIRKYGGGLITTTQNLKDFIGGENSSAQATAVINCSQYFLSFGLQPKDLEDLTKLYKNSGGLTEEEKQAIISADIGEALLFVDSDNRVDIQVSTLLNESRYWQN